MRTEEIIGGRYRLEEPLGAGGMAQVWQATDLQLSRVVAIKFLDTRLLERPEFMVRFFAEAQSVAAVNHRVDDRRVEHLRSGFVVPGRDALVEVAVVGVHRRNLPHAHGDVAGKKR